eukprot:6187173-Pleurochrysis_carterae.AAC.4
MGRPKDRAGTGAEARLGMGEQRRKLRASQESASDCRVFSCRSTHTPVRTVLWPRASIVRTHGDET